MHLDDRELHHLREENELLKSKLKKQQEHQQQQQNNDKTQQDKHQEKKEQEKETDKSVDQEQEEKEEGSHQEQDNESDMYYHPLRKEDFSVQGPVGKDSFSSQEMSVYRPSGPFSFQSRANPFNFQNLL
jgi:hypothetical protein